MKINIMTWNTGISELRETFNKERADEELRKIMNYVDGFLQNKENPIVFLQQMVYKDPDNNYKYHLYYNEFIKNFNTKYDIKYYEKSKFMMTVAIAGKNQMKTLSNEYYPVDKPRNRAIAVEFNGVSFLCIHANGKSVENDAYLKSLHGKADIILGDFNAGNYLKSENRNTFNSILKEHVCICNTPTRIEAKNGRMTCIDHVFIRLCDVTKCSKLFVHEEVNLSDHFPITFEYIKEKMH